MISMKTITCSNSSVIINNGKLTIDGKEVDLEKCLSIKLEGPVREIKADYCKDIEVKGNVDSISTMSGDIKCGDVNGSCSTMSGDIRAGSIKGPCSTMSGDIST